MVKQLNLRSLSLCRSEAFVNRGHAVLQLLDDGRSHRLRVGEVDREQEDVPSEDDAVMQDENEEDVRVLDQSLGFDQFVDHGVYYEGRAVEGQGHGDGGEAS